MPLNRRTGTRARGAKTWQVTARFSYSLAPFTASSGARVVQLFHNVTLLKVGQTPASDQAPNTQLLPLLQK